MTKPTLFLLIANAMILLGFGMNKTNTEMTKMDFGHFSVSLAVNDIQASKTFYESLGFTPLEGAGGVEQKWLILTKDDVKIGLFEGMFPENVLTFNPSDVRSIHALVEKNGISVVHSNGLENTTGPCSFAITDPDGNPILFDQFAE